MFRKKISAFAKALISFSSWGVVLGIVIAVMLSYFVVPCWYSLSIEVAARQTLYSTATGAVTTILAISLSLSLFSVQHAASQYTPGMLRYYVRDPRTWIIFSFFSFAAIFNFLALSNLLPSYAWLTSLILFVGCLYILGLNFVHSANSVRPTALLKKLRHEAAHLISAVPQNDSRCEEVVSQVFYLVRKAAEIRDRETYSEGLDAIVDLFRSHFQSRGSYLYGNRFSDFGYENLNSLGEFGALTSRDTFFLQSLLGRFGTIGIAAARSTSEDDVTPQYSMLACEFLGRLGMLCLRSHLFDACAESMRSIERIGLESILLHHDDALAFDNLTKIGRRALEARDWYAPMVAANSFANLLAASADGRFQVVSFELNLEEVEKFAEAVLSAGYGNRVLSPLYTPKSRGVFEHSLGMVAERALVIKNSEYPREQTHFKEEYVVTLEAAIIAHLGNVGTYSIKSRDRLVCRSIINSLYEIGRSVCLKERFVTFPNHLNNEFQAIVNWLKNFYVISEDTFAVEEVIPALEILSFDSIRQKLEPAISAAISGLKEVASRNSNSDRDEICEGILRVGIYSFELGNQEAASKCLQILKDLDIDIKATLDSLAKRFDFVNSYNLFHDLKDQAFAIFTETVSKDSLRRITMALGLA
jgi:hypothetical protein